MSLFARFLFITTVFFSLGNPINAQENIFSSVNFRNGGKEVESITRYSLFFNFRWHRSFYFTDNIGAYAGIEFRNIGFITENDGVDIQEFEGLFDPSEDNVRNKRRSYSISIPAGLQFGVFDGDLVVFGGGAIALLFNYKEKLFVNGDKEKKFNEWFSDRTNLIMPSLEGGVQIPLLASEGNIRIKFKYYLSNFLNPDYTEEHNGQTFRPYQNIQSQMFSLSVLAVPAYY